MSHKLVMLAFFCLGLGITNAFCQQQPQANQTVVYDPMFWQDKLKLKGWQRAKINEINADFYGAIIQTVKAPAQPTAKENVNKLLTERSERIWSTFSSRQKNIWRKLETEYPTSI